MESLNPDKSNPSSSLDTTMTEPLNIAHRGARSLAPENTLAAARKALAVGANMWELDVGVAADGELIVMHDDSLARTTNVEIIFPERAPWFFTTFTLAEIKRLETGAAFISQDPFEQIAAGIVSLAEQTAMQGEPVPTLREALQFTRDHSWRVNIEIKPIPAPMDSFPLADKVVALIEELDMVEQVIISSFIPLNLARVKKLNSAIDIAVLSRGPLSAAARLFFKIPMRVDIPPLQYFPGDNPPAFLTQLDSQIYHPHYPLSKPDKIKLWQAAGLVVNVWTVNDSNHIQRLIEAGVNGIMTDFPQLLQRLGD